MNAEIITIGNELLYGFTVDTNAAFISRQLALVGVKVEYKTSVGDQADKICQAINLARGRAAIIIITGGLGPTDDDITRDVIAALFQRRLVFQPATWEKIQRQFKTMKRKLPAVNRVQAYIPSGSHLLENLVGNAPGFRIDEGSNHLFVIPGVPREMEHLMQVRILPFLRRRYGLRPIIHRTIRTTGIGESALFVKIRELARPPEVSLAYLPSYTGVDLRLTVPSAKNRPRLRRLEQKIVHLFKDNIYGFDDETIAVVLGKLLQRKRMTLAVAESCTGGLIGDTITQVPGSSAYYLFGAITYSNQTKMDILQVPATLIKQHGAVSAEVALAMAQGVRRAGRADLGLATTGIAGPDGGTLAKPVGMVCVGIASAAHGDQTKTFYFRGDRTTNKTRFSQAALFQLMRFLTGQRTTA